MRYRNPSPIPELHRDRIGIDVSRNVIAQLQLTGCRWRSCCNELICAESGALTSNLADVEVAPDIARRSIVGREIDRIAVLIHKMRTVFGYCHSTSAGPARRCGCACRIVFESAIGQQLGPSRPERGCYLRACGPRCVDIEKLRNRGGPQLRTALRTYLSRRIGGMLSVRRQ